MIQEWARKLLTSDGRVNRLQYLGYHAVCYIMLLCAVLIGILVSVTLSPVLGTAATDTLLVGLAVAVLISYLYSQACITIKRLHDQNLSGWWYAGLLMITFSSGAFQESNPSLSAVLGMAALIANFALLIRPGTDGINRFDAVAEQSQQD